MIFNNYTYESTSETRTNKKKHRSKAFFVLAQWPVKVFSCMGDGVTGDKKTFLLYVFTINHSLRNLIIRESKLIGT